MLFERTPLERPEDLPRRLEGCDPRDFPPSLRLEEDELLLRPGERETLLRDFVAPLLPDAPRFEAPLLPLPRLAPLLLLRELP